MPASSSQRNSVRPARPANGFPPAASTWRGITATAGPPGEGLPSAPAAKGFLSASDEATLPLVQSASNVRTSVEEMSGSSRP